MIVSVHSCCEKKDVKALNSEEEKEKRPFLKIKEKGKTPLLKDRFRRDVQLRKTVGVVCVKRW